MVSIQRTISPVDDSVYVERPLADAAALDRLLTKAVPAQTIWAQQPLDQRIALLSRAVDAFVAKTDAIADELTWQMGRPRSQTPNEVAGFADRARYMLSIANSALAPIEPAPKAGFMRRIDRVPVGVVLVLAPWNYPYLTAVNAIIPALTAGNAVILKHAAQTPLCAERIAEAFAEVGLPEGVFSYVHTSHENLAGVISDPRIGFVCFTGSVSGGHAVQQAAAKGFAGLGLELGGKDPAYVRPDADLNHAIENLVDGAFFNSGQSCCAIERIYVHKSLFDRFVEGAVELTKSYRFGNPIHPNTNLGPLVRTGAAEFVRDQTREAVHRGAKPLIDPKIFAADRTGSPYLAPQILIDVNHSMRVMTEETFGPVVGIMSVSSDEDAVRQMNDSVYGLTAAIWTSDADAANRLGAQLETGTVFMNRCDVLDPALAWTGVKNSGRGCTLSPIGYEQLTRPKSYHFRIAL